MSRRKYTVQFYYYTDERTNWSGPAFNEVHALTLALEHVYQPGWCMNGRGFRVVITSVAPGEIAPEDGAEKENG